MKYQDLNSTLIEKDEQGGHKKVLNKKVFAICFGLIILLLIASVALNFFHLFSNSEPVDVTTPQPKINFDDQRIHLLPKVKNNSTEISCQREFFLFHQDQNHVCEVTGLIIKNDTTNVTIVGNNLTNVLYIFNFEVHKLPKEIFIKFTNLKHLIGNGLKLAAIEKDTFEDAGNLEVLRLSNNDLKELKAWTFKNLRNLKTLDLGRNKLENLESIAFAGLVKLERLYLSDNSLKIVPINLFYPLKNLISLSLDNNAIVNIEDETFINNKQLKSLGLSNNSFSYLQNEIFQYFDNLTDLSLSDLRINSLDLNGTAISTLVVRNTDISNITLSNFPKILVSYGTNIEWMKFIISSKFADFSRIPNWGGMFFNKNIRFLFYFQDDIATQENIEKYDFNFRKHNFLKDHDFYVDKVKFVAVEYEAIIESLE